MSLALYGFPTEYSQLWKQNIESLSLPTMTVAWSSLLCIPAKTYIDLIISWTLVLSISVDSLALIL